MDSIYLDNAATTQVAPEVMRVVTACMGEDFGNSSSAHFMGIRAEALVKEARDHVLGAIGDPEGRRGTLCWTSGGTESDAMGVIGPARALHRRGQRILYTVLEHPAIRESARLLGDQGWRVDAVPTTRRGVVEVEQVLAHLTADTAVVAVMLVNNEIGTIQPVAEIARAVKAQTSHVHVHCDAVQALGKISLDVENLGVDSLALAAHKLHGPKGVGALWVRKGARLIPLWSGGGQQDGLRSGTLNVPGIAGMGVAARLATNGLSARQEHWQSLADILVQAARDSAVPVQIHGHEAPRAPHIVSLGFVGIPAEPLLHVLESRGVLVSAGSACSARDSQPSPVLRAIGVEPNVGTIRFSFGRDTTKDQVETAAHTLIHAIGDF